MVSIVRVALHVGLGLRSSTLITMIYILAWDLRSSILITISCRLFNLAMVGFVVVLCCCPSPSLYRLSPKLRQNVLRNGAVESTFTTTPFALRVMWGIFVEYEKASRLLR